MTETQQAARKRPTKAQLEHLRFLDRMGGSCPVNGHFDFVMRIADRGLVSLYESRPGFYRQFLTEAGRTAIEGKAPQMGPIVTS